MASTIEEQIKAIQEEIDKTQKNKATEYHIGKLKARIRSRRAAMPPWPWSASPAVGSLPC
jgi:ribosome-interacting GTPase 1